MKWHFSYLLISIFFLSTTTQAFKIDTHVWVGQEVINDLERDNFLTFIIDGKEIHIPVPYTTRSAILNNKSDFLLGNIGPDAAPDVAAGQSTVHPGIENGWKTDDWLKHIFSKSTKNQSSLAYGFGYLGHAAADVFAHTYVNQYSGDVFDLEGETLVEQRHIILESYIAKATPALQNSSGQYLGKTWDVVNVDDEIAKFIRDILIYDPNVQKQYAKVDNTQHLKAYGDYREGINTLAELSIWHDIDVAITQLVASYYDIELSSDEASQIVNAAQPVIDVLNQDIPDNLQAMDQKIFDLAKKYEDLGYTSVSSAVKNVKLYEDQLLSYKSQLESKLNELDSRLREKSCSVLDKSITSLTDTITSIDETVDPYGILDPLDVTSTITKAISSLFGSSSNSWSYSDTGTREELIDQAYSYINEKIFTGCYAGGCTYVYPNKERGENLLYVAQSFDPMVGGEYTVSNSNGGAYMRENFSGFKASCLAISNVVDSVRDSKLDAIRALASKIQTSKTNMINAVGALRNELLLSLNSVKNIENALIDLAQIPGADVSPIQSILRNWRSDVDIALTAYVKAANQTMINTVNPDADILEPITTWFNCYHKRIIGVPGAISGCKFTDSIAQLNEALDNILLILDSVSISSQVLGFSPKAEVKKLKEQLVTSLKDKLKEEITDEVMSLIPEELREVLEASSESVDDEVLNRYFTKGEGTDGVVIIMIPDIAQRVKKEMSMRQDGTFDKQSYAVIYNAVVMAKLALLDKQGLQTLANYASSNTIINSSFTNLIAPAFTSIDGNHQWMEKSPPLPNSQNIYSADLHSYSSAEGFLLWKGDLRDTLFRKLFKGPISPGIDNPELIGFSDIIGNNYPYKVCESAPFPDGLNENKCQ